MAETPPSVADLVRERANRFGPIPFDEFMELALYAPDSGFYESGGAAGGDARGGDFLTSPSIGQLFGAVLARALDSWWDELDQPDPFVVIEAAASTGELCRAVLAAAPRCLPALRYLLVERSDVLRAQHPAHLPIEPAAHVLGPVAPSDEEDEEGARVLPGGGPRVASLPDLPAGPIVGVVFANELLDNIPFALVERSDDGWREVRVNGELEESLVPAAPALASHADRLVPAAAPGARIPIQRRAGQWLWSAMRILHAGRIVVFDYAVSSTSELAARPAEAWLRTFRGGGRGSSPLDRPGVQDITADVCIDQLSFVAPPDVDRSQAEFLAAHGIDQLVAAARDEWQAGAAKGTLDAVRARSRMSEADALTDEAGLGGFRVIEWVI